MKTSRTTKIYQPINAHIISHKKILKHSDMFRSCQIITRELSSLLKLYYYLLTYSMVQSPSWAANWFAASQEFPRISWNPKVHYRTHKRPPPVPILGQPNPVPNSDLRVGVFLGEASRKIHREIKSYIIVFTIQLVFANELLWKPIRLCRNVLWSNV